LTVGRLGNRNTNVLHIWLYTYIYINACPSSKRGGGGEDI
jgi:hypothetical protein